MIGMAHSEKEMLASEFTPRKLFASTRALLALTAPAHRIQTVSVSTAMVK